MGRFLISEVPLQASTVGNIQGQRIVSSDIPSETWSGSAREIANPERVGGMADTDGDLDRDHPCETCPAFITKHVS